MADFNPRTRFFPFALLAVFLTVLAGCNPQPPSALGPGHGPGSVTPVNVALLVPSESGDRRQDMLAESLVQAAQLAISDFGDGAQIDLRVYPTAGNPETAVQAVQQAAENDADIILGPLFSNVTTAVSHEAARHNLNVLSFSNNPEVAGDNVYVLGISFQNTANQLIAHASSRGLSRIAVVAAQNQAGRLAAGAVETAAVINGASVVGVATYERTATGAIDAMPIIRRTVAESLPDVVVIDADSAGALPIFAEMLPDPGTDEISMPEDIQYIGLTRWDIPKATLRHEGLQGGWFALPDPGLYDAFVVRFHNAYGKRPHILAGLAYDGIQLIGTLAQSFAHDALSARRLTRAEGFVGVNGGFRLRADGTVVRRLAIAEVRDGWIEIIDPAELPSGGATRAGS